MALITKIPLMEYRTFNEAQAEIITEADAAGAGKTLYMKGIFLQAGIKNHNGRVYPLNEIRNAVETIRHSIAEGLNPVGEADHPEELNINLDRVSHIITDMHMDGENGVGKLKIVPTPMGNIISTLLQCGVKLGVSSRGSGNVADNGEVSDFEIVTVDIVARPSAPDAYPKAVYEALGIHRRGPIIADLAEAVRHDRKAQKYLKEELLGWIKGLKS
jgi:hypothetical protein